MSSPISGLSPTYSHGDLVIVRAVTPLHVGSGRAGKFVDLPVQRDEFGYPCIYSSSLKGALKTALLNGFLRALGDSSKARKAVTSLLGPEPGEGETFESSVAILDAYLLAMPVRSLMGVYAYVTSPHLLKIFIERCYLLEALMSEGSEGIDGLCRKLESELGGLSPENDKAICIGGCESVKVREFSDRAVLAEEFFLTIATMGEKAKIEGLMRLVNSVGLEKPLLIVDDDVARGLIERGIVRATRIKLEREKKTSEGLWTEEYLPKGTILHTMFLYKRPSCRPQQSSTGSEDVINSYLQCLKGLGLVNKEFKVEGLNPLDLQNAIVEEVVKTLKDKIINKELKSYMVLGGHETIGRGIVKLQFLEVVKQ